MYKQKNWTFFIFKEKSASILLANSSIVHHSLVNMVTQQTKILTFKGDYLQQKYSK